MLVNMLIQCILILYLIVTGMILPLYMQGREGYSHIGTDKVSFYIRSAGMLAGILAGLLLCLLIKNVVHKIKRKPISKEVKKSTYKILPVLKTIVSKNSTLFFVVSYMLCIVLSYIFSNYREFVLYGSKGWYMGLAFQCIVLIFYFVGVWQGRKCRESLLEIPIIMILVVSTVIFVLGILNRYGLNPLGMVDKGPHFISTIGNINWYCGYFSVVFPLGVSIYCLSEKKHHEVTYQAEKFSKMYENIEDLELGNSASIPKKESIRLYYIKKISLAVYIIIGFMAGLTQGSDTGIGILMVMLLVLGTISIRKQEYWQNFLEVVLLFCITLKILAWIEFCYPEKNTYISKIYLGMINAEGIWLILIITGVVYAKVKKGNILFFKRCQKIWKYLSSSIVLVGVSLILVILIHTVFPEILPQLHEKSLFTFNESWGNGRGATWRIGIYTWLSQDALHKLFGVGVDGMEAYLYSGMNPELLHYTQSIFGTVRLTNAHGEWLTLLVNTGMLGMISFAGIMVSAIRRFWQSKNSIVMACGMSVLIYTIHNIFSFQQVMNVTQIFIVLVIGECVLQRGLDKDNSV